MSNGITVLAAFNSPTMRKMIVNLLQEKGYETVEAENGKEVFDIIVEKKVDCIIAYVDLPEINGYGISRIIKNTKELQSISVILSSTEDNSEFRFWSENSKSDQFYVARANNGNYLDMLIKNALEKRKDCQQMSMTDFQKKSFHSIIQSAYDREIFDLYIVNNAFKAASSIFDFSGLINRMADCLAGVCEYDAAAVLINDEPLIQRFYRKGPVSDQDFHDFMEICHSDFRKRIQNRKEYNWENCDSQTDTIETTFEENRKIKSYEIFPLDSEKNLLTFHVASCQEDAFSRKTRERLDFFVSLYSTLIENAVEYHRTKLSEQKMRNSFARFLPAQIINDIVSGKTSVSDSVGENRKVAVLIADIRDFTSISELNAPDKVVNFLNYFFETMGAIIKKHGGTIDKFMGDCIMALFGAPDSYIDNGNRAANAALEMVQADAAMEKVKAKIKDDNIKLPEGYNFDFGVGIHYGDMIVGTIGSSEKKDYTVIGDNVNIASRIEGLTKIFGSRIIVTEDVKADTDFYSNSAVEGSDRNLIEHSTRHLGVVKVKGKSKPVKIYELCSDTSRFSQTYIEKYAKGLDRYISRDLEGALEYFRAASEEMPEDKASIYCIEQCIRQIHSLNSDDWDGTFKFGVK